MTQGQAAERLVADRLRAALPSDYRIFQNVAWLGRTAPERGLREGEADIVLAADADCVTGPSRQHP